MSLEFLITSFVVVLLPGTGVLYTLAIGLSRGFKASIAAALGCTLGIVPAAFASIVGLAALLHTSALAFQALKFLGAAYLLYMAWHILRDEGAMAVSEQKSQTRLNVIARRGMMINVLNPKLSLFFLAFLPQFVSPGTPDATTKLLLLAAVFMIMTFIVFVCYGAFAAAARRHVIQKPNVMRWIRRSFAGVFGILGAQLALKD